MKTIAVLAAVTAAALFTTQAMACQPITFDANGNWIGGPRTLDEHIAASGRSFVGTVVGYRNTDGVLIEENIQDCETLECYELGNGVITVVLHVEHAIEGVEDGQLYEEAYDLGDGDCGPWFEAGHRYIYTSYTFLFGSSELERDWPSPTQLAYWRSLVHPNPAIGTADNPGFLDPDCTPPEDVLSELAPNFLNEYPIPQDAYIGRIRLFRLDDATLTDDASPCNDRASSDCAAFRRRIVTVVVDTEAVVSGERPLGRVEVLFPEAGAYPPVVGCVPKAGQRYLMTSGRWPGFLLPTPPDEDQINQWRNAIRGWRD